jgi:hypothetical protein
MEQGLIDADLGSNIYKKRVALPSQGKSGSLRTIIAYQFKDKAFYVYGFAKGKRANIRDDELKVFKLLSADLISNDDDGLNQMIEAEELIEVDNNE